MRRYTMKAAFILIGILFISTVAFSATIYVPDHYPTIQAAINASVSGDTVIVRPGTYVENIDFVGKAITVRSNLGSSVTSIDGNQAGSVVTFQNGEALDSILKGFTMTNGKAQYGGGIYLYDASPDIADSIITGNTATQRGGGIACDESSNILLRRSLVSDNTSTDNGGGIYVYRAAPFLKSNTISGNRSVQGSGGGIACEYANPFVRNNTITDNFACDLGGGGIFCGNASNPKIQDNTITWNTVTGGLADGGGINCFYNEPTITNNIISENTADCEGGGIYGGGVDAIITNNIISNNTARSGGGILTRMYLGPIITNNTISRNTATWGGGIECKNGANPTLRNNTISGNTATFGGGIECRWNSSPTIMNSIVWGNTATTGPEIYVESGFPTVTYSDVKGGWTGTGNIDANPLFGDPVRSDFHLKWSSPCRNAGDNNAVADLYDFEGDPRIALGTVDMGADEFYYHLYYIGDAVPGALIDMNVIGLPGYDASIAIGWTIKDPPSPTLHGDLWLSYPFTKVWKLGAIPGSGVLSWDGVVPSGWSSGSQHPFQALVGPWGGTNTQLTNLMVLTVE
jgi:parallel beta-helix repeat protein/predicted outer membrane repeat protein